MRCRPIIHKLPFLSMWFKSKTNVGQRNVRVEDDLLQSQENDVWQKLGVTDKATPSAIPKVSTFLALNRKLTSQIIRKSLQRCTILDVEQLEASGAPLRTRHVGMTEVLENGKECDKIGKLIVESSQGKVEDVVRSKKSCVLVNGVTPDSNDQQCLRLIFHPTKFNLSSSPKKVINCEESEGWQHVNYVRDMKLNHHTSYGLLIETNVRTDNRERECDSISKYFCQLTGDRNRTFLSTIPTSCSNTSLLSMAHADEPFIADSSHETMSCRTFPSLCSAEDDYQDSNSLVYPAQASCSETVTFPQRQFSLNSFCYNYDSFKNLSPSTVSSFQQKYRYITSIPPYGSPGPTFSRNNKDDDSGVQNCAYATTEQQLIIVPSIRSRAELFSLCELEKGPVAKSTKAANTTLLYQSSKHATDGYTNGEVSGKKKSTDPLQQVNQLPKLQLQKIQRSLSPHPIPNSTMGTPHYVSDSTQLALAPLPSHCSLEELNTERPNCCNKCKSDCSIWELCQPVKCVIDQNEVEILPAVHEQRKAEREASTEKNAKQLAGLKRRRNQSKRFPWSGSSCSEKSYTSGHQKSMDDRSFESPPICRRRSVNFIESKMLIAA